MLNIVIVSSFIPFFDESKSILENAYYFSSVLIALSALIGLYQLYLIKSNRLIQAKREAATFSANQVELFLKEITSLMDKLDRKMNEEKLPGFQGEVGNFTFRDVANKVGLGVIENYLKFMEDMGKTDWIDLKVMNALDAFSFYFVNGIADEEIAFKSVGQSFCNSVQKYYIFIAFVRRQEKEIDFDHIRQLYSLWNKRLINLNIEEQYNLLQKKIDNIRKEKKNIRPIGT